MTFARINLSGGNSPASSKRKAETLMSKNQRWQLRLTILLALLTLSGCKDQVTLKQAQLDDWFYSRLIWVPLAAFAAGLLVSHAHLCKLKVRAGELSVRSRARRYFIFWLLIVFLAWSSFLFVDAWLIYPFSNIMVGPMEAFSQVLLSYRSAGILALSLIVFYLTVALSTRLSNNCRCQFDFVPKLGGK